MKVKNRRGDEAEAKVKKCSIRKASVLFFTRTRASFIAETFGEMAGQ